MSVPANVLSELSALQTQVAAAKPLQSAPYATIKAIQLNAQNLVADIDAAVISTMGSLDTWTAPTDPDLMVSGVLSLLQNAVDQTALTNMRGFVGRATSNLDQL